MNSLKLPMFSHVRQSLMAVTINLAVLAIGIEATHAQLKFDPLWFGHGVVLEASDLHQEGSAKHTFRLIYYHSVLTRSLGDDDIWVVSPNGFNGFAKLEGLERIQPRDVFPEDVLNQVAGVEDDGSVDLPWLFGPAVAATYSLAAPDGETWKASDNGAYSVLVADGAVALSGGGSVPHQLLGTFAVRIGEPPTVNVVDFGVDISNSDEGCTAAVKLLFDRSAEVDWGEVMRDGERLFVRIEAVATDAAVAPDASHVYKLGDLPPGTYRLEVHVNDRLITTKRFLKEDEPTRVPAEVNVDIVRSSPDVLPEAHVTVHFLRPGWSIVDPGVVSRRGNRFFVNAIASQSIALDAQEEGELWEKVYRIPEAEPGIYTFTFCLNDQVCDSSRFKLDPLPWQLRVRGIDIEFTGEIACTEANEDEAGGFVEGCFYQHNATVGVALAPGIRIADWGEPVTDGRMITINILTGLAPDVRPADGIEPVPGDEVPDEPGVTFASHIYDLGLLEEGPWMLEIQANGTQAAVRDFVSNPSPGIESHLRTEPLDPTVKRHTFHVIYEGKARIDLGTLGDGDIKVQNPIIHVINFAGPIPHCLSQNAELVKFEASDNGLRVDAVYAIACEETWGRWGRTDEGLEVFQLEDSVKTVTGLGIARAKIGNIPFKDDDSLALEAHADAPPVHEPNEVAEIHVSYASRTAINVNTLGDNDVAIMHPGEPEPVDPAEPGDDGNANDVVGALFFAKLREFKATDDRRHVEAIYELIPSDGWTARWNGEHRLILAGGTIANRQGAENKRISIGVLHVEVEPGRVDGSAKIEIEQGNATVLAHVKTELVGAKIVSWGSPVQRGNTFFLDATAQKTRPSVNHEQEHTYRLVPIRRQPSEPVKFEVIPDSAVGPATFTEPLEIVVRNKAEWEELITKFWDPDVDAEMPEPPADFAEEMIVGVALGERPSGFDVNISEISKTADGHLTVNYVESIPGVEPLDDFIHFPFELVRTRLSDLPVEFSASEIELPAPPPGGDDGEEPREVRDEVNGDIPVDGTVVYLVVFRVNGHALARTSFRYPGEDKINAKADIDIVRTPNGIAADVHVAFSGFPYHMISDWGKVRRVGNSFFLPSEADRVDFIIDPGVIEQKHRYHLTGLPSPHEPIPFEPLDVQNWHALLPAELVIQTPDEWADAYGRLSPLDGPVPEVPVDLEEHTIVAVLQSMKPNGCYAVEIVEVGADADGNFTVYFRSKVPAPDDACPEVITFPQSFVAIPKTSAPISFAEVNAAPADLVNPNDRGTCQVFFLINEVTFARTSFRHNDRPEPKFHVSIRAKGGDHSAKVAVELRSLGDVILSADWGAATIDRHVISANVNIELGGDLDPEDGGAEDILAEDDDIRLPLPPENFARHLYEFSDLKPGFYTFQMTVNGERGGHAFFFVTQPGLIPFPFEEWLAGVVESVDDAARKGLADVLGDLDGDGMRDEQEFFLGTDPLRQDVPPVRPEWVVDDKGKGHMAICFQRRKNAGMEAVVEASADLNRWDDSPELFDRVRVVDLEGGIEEVVVCLKSAAGDSPMRFLRLKLLATP